MSTHRPIFNTANGLRFCLFQTKNLTPEFGETGGTSRGLSSLLTSVTAQQPHHDNTGRADSALRGSCSSWEGWRVGERECEQGFLSP